MICEKKLIIMYFCICSFYYVYIYVCMYTYIHIHIYVYLDSKVGVHRKPPWGPAHGDDRLAAFADHLQRR